MTEEAVQAAPSFPTDMNALHTVANCPTWTCRWLVAHLPSPGLELSPVMNAHSQESAERKAGSGSAPSHTPKPSRRSYPLLPKLSTYTPRCHEIIKSTPLPPSKKRNLKANPNHSCCRWSQGHTAQWRGWEGQKNVLLYPGCHVSAFSQQKILTMIRLCGPLRLVSLFQVGQAWEGAALCLVMV